MATRVFTNRSQRTILLGALVGAIGACNPSSSSTGTDANTAPDDGSVATDASHVATPDAHVVTPGRDGSVVTPLPDAAVLPTDDGDTVEPDDAAVDDDADPGDMDADLPVDDDGGSSTDPDADNGNGNGDDGGGADAAPVDAELPYGVPICNGPDTNVTNSFTEARYPMVVWTGSEYGIVWEAGVGPVNPVTSNASNDIFMARVGSDGTVRGSVRVTQDNQESLHPHITWDGTKYWIAWEDASTSIRVASVTPSGTSSGTVGTPVTVNATNAAGTQRPTIAAIPAAYGGGVGVAWEDGRNGNANHEIYYAHLGSDGHVIGTDVRVTNALRYSGMPKMVWHPTLHELAILYPDDRDGSGDTDFANEELYFARLNGDGTRVGGSSDVRVTNEPYRSIWPAINPAGDHYAISWANEFGVPDSVRVYFLRLQQDGSHTAGADPLRISLGPEDAGSWTSGVAWNGTNYLVVYEDQRHPYGEIFMQWIDADGNKLGGEHAMYNDDEWSAYVNLTAGPSGDLFAVWEDNRAGGRDIWTRRITANACQ